MTDIEREALTRRIDELCAEVERLRNQLHDQQDTAGHNFVRNAREYKRVCDENAKLRELAAVMLRCWDADCDGCPMAVKTTVYGAVTCTAESKLRELGVVK